MNSAPLGSHLAGFFLARNGTGARIGSLLGNHSARPHLRRWNMLARFSNLIRDESGATAIEYGLIAALISVVIIAAVKLVGSNLSSTFNKVATNL
jgi:pilus assembly protein Flp/PilA